MEIREFSARVNRSTGQRELGYRAVFKAWQTCSLHPRRAAVTKDDRAADLLPHRACAMASSGVGGVTGRSTHRSRAGGRPTPVCPRKAASAMY